MNKRVSELITIEQIKTWNNNNVITITAGTGAGKSYFIKNILYAFAKSKNKKILYLIHRINCINQFKEELKSDNKLDIIDLMSYQHIETSILNKNTIDLSKYEYIVADEFHYFMSDASFNISTDISLNYILNQSCIKIFMSATGDYCKRYINNILHINTIDYELPIKYNFIKSLTFYNLDTTLDDFLDNYINENEKAIFFIQSAKKAYELYLRHKDKCIFNCSKSNKDYYKYVEVDTINNMLVNEKFNSLALITTTCLDAGVNIIDDKVKHIIVDNKDLGSLIQCLGRKRLKNNEQIYVYIKSINNKSLGATKGHISNRIKKAEYLRKHTIKEYLKEFPRAKANDLNNIIYDISVDEDDNKCTKKINELMYFKSIEDICIIDAMLFYGKYGYNKYIANKLNIEKYRLIEEDCKMNKLELYLNSIVDKRLYKEDQQELINMINVKVNGKQQKSYAKLNQGLQMLELPYIIISKRVKENNILKTVWIVNKL